MSDTGISVPPDRTAMDKAEVTKNFGVTPAQLDPPTKFYKVRMKVAGYRSLPQNAEIELHERECRILVGRTWADWVGERPDDQKHVDQKPAEKAMDDAPNKAMKPGKVKVKA